MRLKWDSLLCTDRERQLSSMSPSPSDTRSRFKKDYDTICNSTALRRMQDKAQVFPLENSDYSRTRLTHSIEVMSIAESLGTSAVKTILSKEKDLTEETITLINDIPMLLKAAALLHDMGNPPFGHLGEEIIGKWFLNNLGRLHITEDGKAEWHSGGKPQEYLSSILQKQCVNDLVMFDGNAQLLRLITKLSYTNDEYGMNLSYALLATIIKYPVNSLQVDKNCHIHKKPGYFFSEQKLFDTIQKKVGLNGKRHPLTFLLEAADDIAYLTADIEDAHKKRVLTKETIICELRKKKGDVLIDDVLGKAKEFEKDGKRIGYPNIDTFVVQKLRIYIKGKLIEAAYSAFSELYDSIMNGRYYNELLDEKPSVAIKSILSKLEKERIFYCSEITNSKIKAYMIINTIIERIVMSVINNRNNDMDDIDSLIYNRLSENYKFVCNMELKNSHPNKRASILYTKLLLATDYVSGMTDTYARDYYNMLMASV